MVAMVTCYRRKVKSEEGEVTITSRLDTTAATCCVVVVVLPPMFLLLGGVQLQLSTIKYNRIKVQLENLYLKLYFIVLFLLIGV